MVSKRDYMPEEVLACKKVLVEIVHILGEIKDEMVICYRPLIFSSAITKLPM